MRILVLLTDAYGGRGGIAQHNRHLLRAISTYPEVEQVVVLPRLIEGAIDDLPPCVTFSADAAGSKWRYVATAVRAAFDRAGIDIVVCGHINLLLLAVVVAWCRRAQLVQIVHGIEAWRRPGTLRRWLMRRVDCLVAVSDFTRRKVLAWSNLPEERTKVIPNAVDLAAFGPGPKRTDLLARYGLEGKIVMLTLSRLSSTERYKGHDEVLEVLSELALEIPNIAYVIAGDGDDRERLGQKAEALGVADRVVFTGYVPEAEKADHFRLSDVFVMPGRGEGFGIVYLEALACGVPVIASNADASGEAVLGGAMGVVVDPDDSYSLKEGIRKALQGNRGAVPGKIHTFSHERYQERWHRVLQLFATKWSGVQLRAQFIVERQVTSIANTRIQFSSYQH